MTSESRFMKRDSSRNIRKLTSRPFKMRRRARFIGNSRDLLLHRFATTDGCILKRDAIIHRASNPLWRNPDSLAIPCKTPKHRRERRILTVAPHLGRMLVKKQGELLSDYPISCLVTLREIDGPRDSDCDCEGNCRVCLREGLSRVSRPAGTRPLKGRVVGRRHLFIPRVFLSRPEAALIFQPAVLSLSIPSRPPRFTLLQSTLISFFVLPPTSLPLPPPRILFAHSAVYLI